MATLGVPMDSLRDSKLLQKNHPTSNKQLFKLKKTKVAEEEENYLDEGDSGSVSAPPPKPPLCHDSVVVTSNRFQGDKARRKDAAEATYNKAPPKPAKPAPAAKKADEKVDYSAELLIEAAERGEEMFPELEYRRPATSRQRAIERRAFDKAIYQFTKQPSSARTLKEFDQVGMLGEGSFGKVLLVKHKGELKALKVQDKSGIYRDGQVAHLRDERKYLLTLKSRFLVECFDSFHDSKSVFFIMELMIGGELYDHMSHQPGFCFDAKTAKFMVAQVTLGLEYLHNLDLIYRDLKPENLLLDERGNLRITDLGFVKRVPDITFTMCGTPEYIAPEVILDKGYGRAVDWWSLGVLAYELISGDTPFRAKTEKQLFLNIITLNYKFPPVFSAVEKHFIEQLLQVDLTKRLGYIYGGVEKLKSHPFFQEIDWSALEAGKMDPPYKPRVKSKTDLQNFASVGKAFDQIKWQPGADRFGNAFEGF